MNLINTICALNCVKKNVLNKRVVWCWKLEVIADNIKETSEWKTYLNVNKLINLGSVYIGAHTQNKHLWTFYFTFETQKYWRCVRSRAQVVIVMTPSNIPGYYYFSLFFYLSHWCGRGTNGFLPSSNRQQSRKTCCCRIIILAINIFV